MKNPIYATGQLVHVDAASLSGPSTRDDFRVVRRYRASGVPDFYRLQSMMDRSERMVPAHELTTKVPTLLALPKRIIETAAFVAGRRLLVPAAA